jgi:3-phosphoshikimate 1-carboxyvinyltransferase
MQVRVSPHLFTGLTRIPASKSHTIRQLLTASLASGVSQIHYPLDSLDARSCVCACRAFGAEITEEEKDGRLIKWEVKGNGGFKTRGVLTNTKIDVGNSGTTLYLALAIAALQPEPVVFTGDGQIQRRSAAELLGALCGLGAKVESRAGCAPITVNGPWAGGKVSLSCPTSQYLSALLIAAPLAPADIVTEIEVPLLNEKPYIEMTLSYLKAQGIPFQAKSDFSHFVIPGGAVWKPFSRSVPGDFSSAAFPAASAAITGGPVTLLGLDPEDTQGDKFFLDMLKSMGCKVEWSENDGKEVKISRDKPLKGGIFDLNATPDLLPAAAVTAAYANGDTSLVNVAHARIKETDRIAVMVKELEKVGVKCTELPDGMVIHGKGGIFPGKSAVIDGHGDHRIVMAFAAAALGSPYPLEISSAESANVTYPGFLELLRTEKP